MLILENIKVDDAGWYACYVNGTKTPIIAGAKLDVVKSTMHYIFYTTLLIIVPYSLSAHFIFVLLHQNLDTDENDQDSEKGDDGYAIDRHGKTGYYDAAEDSTVPKFTKIDNMHRVVAKPAGNMLRLKCTAEGKCLLFIG